MDVNMSACHAGSTSYFKRKHTTSAHSVHVGCYTYLHHLKALLTRKEQEFDPLSQLNPRHKRLSKPSRNLSRQDDNQILKDA